MLFHLMCSNLCYGEEGAEQMEEMRKTQVEKKKGVEAAPRDEKRERKGEKIDN